MRIHRHSVAIGIACMAAACASSSEDIGAAYVSPLQYQHYDCNQIALESQRVSSRASALAGEVDSNATGDAVAMGVGLVLFWPALFFIDGDGPQANEYAQLKGEYTALQQASVEKKCSIGFPEIEPAAGANDETAAEKYGQPAVGTSTPTN